MKTLYDSENLFRAGIESIASNKNYQQNCYTSQWSNTDWCAYMRKEKEKDGNFKLVENIRRRMGIALEGLYIRKRCKYCWISLKHCVCPQMVYLAHLVPDIKFVLCMHSHEFSRVSNSGKVVGACFAAEILLEGLESSRIRISEILEAYHFSCVLYPGSKSTSMPSYINSVLLGKNRDSPKFIDSTNYYTVVPKETTIKPKPWVIFLIDSTWNQSKALEKVIPDYVPRVALDPGLVASHNSILHPVRRRTRFSGVSTAEAVVLFLHTIGASRDKVVDPFINSIRAMVNAACVEKHVYPPYLNLSEN